MDDQVKERQKTDGVNLESNSGNDGKISRIWALIPAKLNSRRIPGKNFRELCGKSLLERAIDSAIESGIFSRIIISSDTGRAFEIVDSFWSSGRGKNVDFHFASPDVHLDHTNDIDWITDIFTSDNYDPDQCDLYFILRPTSPFRTAETIRRALLEFIEDENFLLNDGMKSVQLAKQGPEKMWRPDSSNRNFKMVPYFIHGLAPVDCGGRLFELQSSNFLPLLVQNGCIDICYPQNLGKNGGYMGMNIIPFYTQGLEGLNIDYHEDFEYAEYLMEKLQNSGKGKEDVEGVKE